MKHLIPYPLVLETERLIIRSPQESDGAGLNAAIADSFTELHQWMPWAQAIPSVKQSIENCRNAVKEFKEGEDYRLHLFLKDPMTFIGCSGIHRFDWEVPRAEIGYWLRSSYTGQGFMTEAVGEITRYLIEDLEMNRVEIRMSAQNVKSRAIPQRLGFTFEGILRNEDRHPDGNLRDTCIYALIPHS